MTNRRLLTKHSARYARRAMDQVFEGIERLAEEENLSLDWPSLRVRVGPETAPALHPDERLLEMLVEVDGTEQ